MGNPLPGPYQLDPFQEIVGIQWGPGVERDCAEFNGAQRFFDRIAYVTPLNCLFGNEARAGEVYEFYMIQTTSTRKFWRTGKTYADMLECKFVTLLDPGFTHNVTARTVWDMTDYYGDPKGVGYTSQFLCNNGLFGSELRVYPGDEFLDLGDGKRAYARMWELIDSSSPIAVLQWTYVSNRTRPWGINPAGLPNIFDPDCVAIIWQGEPYLRANGMTWGSAAFRVLAKSDTGCVWVSRSYTEARGAEQDFLFTPQGDPGEHPLPTDIDDFRDLMFIPFGYSNNTDPVWRLRDFAPDFQCGNWLNGGPDSTRGAWYTGGIPVTGDIPGFPTHTWWPRVVSIYNDGASIEVRASKWQLGGIITDPPLPGRNQEDNIAVMWE